MEDLDVSGVTSFSQIRDVNEQEMEAGRRESFKLTRKGNSLFEEIEDDNNNNNNNKQLLNKRNSKKIKEKSGTGKKSIVKGPNNKKKVGKKKTGASNEKRLDNISLIQYLEVNSSSLSSDDDKTFLSGDEEENAFSLSPVKQSRIAKASSVRQTKLAKDSTVKSNKINRAKNAEKAMDRVSGSETEELLFNSKTRTENEVVKKPNGEEEENKVKESLRPSKANAKAKGTVKKGSEEENKVRQTRSSRAKPKSKEIHRENIIDHIVDKAPIYDDLIDNGKSISVENKDHIETFNVPLKDDPKSIHQTMKSHEISKVVKPSTPRRSSLASRGKRLSSIKGSTILPHDSIPLSEFHKHLDPNLPTPHKLKTLLIWICERLIKNEKGKDKKKIEKLLSMIHSNSLDINWWGQEEEDDDDDDGEIKNRIQFLKGQCFEFDEELAQLKSREDNHLGELKYDYSSHERINVEPFISNENENELKLINERVQTFELVMKKTKVIAELTDKVLEFKKDLIIQELKKSIEVDSINLLRMLYNNVNGYDRT